MIQTLQHPSWVGITVGISLAITLVACSGGRRTATSGGSTSPATVASGGVAGTATGGAVGSGGSNVAGGGSARGTVSAGGTTSVGGTTNAGGSRSTGGTTGTGASAPTGGTTSTGGTISGGGATGGTAGSTTSGALPEGNNGIAAHHAGDLGIAGDTDVIFADDFESYAQAADILKRWDNMYQNQYVAITTTAANVYAGKQALEFTLPQQTAELSDAVEKIVSPELDVLFLRYYSKFQPPYDVVGSSHNGSSISAHYEVGFQSTPGVPANGTNKFLANLENWRGEAATVSPGDLNIYIYHPLQRSQWGDHFFPTGLVMPNTSIAFDFGPDFVSRPDIIPTLDRWYAYELMVKANTPGQNDGRIAAWVDGKLTMDFPNLRLRDVASLTIDRFALCFHIGSNPNGQSKKWYDNVVAAKAYIGPMVK